MARTGSKDPSSSSAVPAGLIPTPKKRGRPKGTGIPYSQRLQGDVALLRAEGMTHARVAKSLDISVDMERRIAYLPEVQARINSLREKYREIAQQRGVETATKMWDKLDAAVENDEAKKANLYSFGLSALDRISHNTSGEKQKVEVSGIPGEQNPRIEIKNLLVALFGEPKPLSGN